MSKLVLMANESIGKLPGMKLFTIVTGGIFGYGILSVLAFFLFFAAGFVVGLIVGEGWESTQAGLICLYLSAFALLNLMSVVPMLIVVWLGLVLLYVTSIGLAVILKVPGILRNSSEDQAIKGLQSETPGVRKSAILECGRLRLYRAEPLLTSLLLTDPDIDIRMCAYYVLEGLNLPKMRIILNALNDAPNKGYRLNLIRLLGKLTNNRQVFALTDLYLKDSDVDVRLAILAVFDGFYPADTVDLLLKMMSASEDKKLKLKLLSVLHKYDHILTVEPLVKMLKTETDRDVRLAIYSVLGDIKDVRSNEVFFQALQDGDPEIRNLAAETLKRLGIKFANRDVVKEIVKAPCKYCGTLVEVTCSKCISCGAPLQR